MVITQEVCQESSPSNPIQEIVGDGKVLLRVESPRWHGEDVPSSLWLQQEFYASIFDLAAKRRVTHLTLPLLGTTTAGVPAHFAVEALWKSACQSRYEGHCTIVTHQNSQSLGSESHELLRYSRRLYFERPSYSTYVRTHEEPYAHTPDSLRIPDSDKPTLIEQGTDDDTFSSHPSHSAQNPFASTDALYDAALKEDTSLATSLYGATRPLYFAPNAFIMTPCGMLPNKSMVVVFQLLGTCAVHGPGVHGHYGKGDFVICRLAEGRGTVSFTFPNMPHAFKLQFFTSETLRASFRGCVIGGALGDALGYTVQGMSLDAITKRYGPRGIETLQTSPLGCTPFSSNTQMMLFTMDGLRQGIVRAENKGISAKPAVYVLWAYLDWLATQRHTMSDQQYSAFTNLYRSETSLRTQRTPSTACLEALTRTLVDGANPPYSCTGFSQTRPANTSKGCAAVARVAPIGLMLSSNHWIGNDGAAQTAASVAALTHGHDLAHLSAAYLAELIHRLTYQMDGSSLHDALKNTLHEVERQFPTSKHLPAFSDIIQRAWKLGADAMSSQPTEPASADEERRSQDQKNIESLGAGKTAEEALAMAVYCVWRYPHDFHRALRAAVNHSGYSDAVGMIVGSILGCHFGMDGIAQQGAHEEIPLCIGQLELSSRLQYWADMAYAVVMYGIHDRWHVGKPFGPNPTCYLVDNLCICAEDRSTGSFFRWVEPQQTWVEDPSMLTQMEWGGSAYRDMVLLDGFTVELPIT